MKASVFAICALWFAASAHAALDVGAKAPMFTAPATLNGNEFEFSLAEALKKGPVVMYFYPAAFTKGCTVEAHNFAEAVDQYHALGASIIGVSADNIDVLNKFSVSECQGKFPVASDAGRTIMQSYDAVLAAKPELSNRTSYVISPEGKVLYSHTDLLPDKHVSNTLEALKKWKADKK
ncbi:MAG: peroxiredoxin [Spongiibacteraceae bacterium]